MRSDLIGCDGLGYNARSVRDHEALLFVYKRIDWVFYDLIVEIIDVHFVSDG